MIDALSRTLKVLLESGAGGIDRSEFVVDFQRPGESEYKPVRATLNLFLFDVRENVELRSNEPLIERKNGKAVVSKPPFRLACSYLVTAWAGGEASGEQAALKEQGLLGRALLAFARNTEIPPDSNLWQGPLAQPPQPLPAPIALRVAEELRDPAQFWTALGNKLKPALVVTATVAIPLSEPDEGPLALQHLLRMGLRAQGSETHFRPETVEESRSPKSPPTLP